MADFSLADALADDTPGQASRTATANPSAPVNGAPHATNPGWPGSAPGGPGFHQQSGGPAQPSAPGSFPQPSAPGGFSPPSGPYAPGPGAPPGPYPSVPSAPAGPTGPYGGPGAPGGMMPGSGAAGHFVPGPGAPSGPYPGAPSVPPSYPPGQGQFGFPGVQYPSCPAAPQGPFGNTPYPAGPPAPGGYGHPGPGGFPPATGGFPPVPPGSWGTPGGGYHPQHGPQSGFGTGPMGPYGGPGAPGGMLPVPYDLPLHAGIMPRLLITVVGEPVPGADRFHVDFVKGSDIVFHFNPRFPEQTIVRNSSLGGYWGPEERGGGFPFVPGRQFELKILVEADVFKVAVDGVHLLEYEHRVGGMEEVTLLRVVGDVTLYSVAPSMI
ncbi:galectin-3 isoform X1 [Hoplias malabaricus]|uniref:galectin-3 isoform X1 n=1 Tax=Hoplias malabaricus TaxID=27720 RepID=UPI00346363E9